MPSFKYLVIMVVKIGYTECYVIKNKNCVEFCLHFDVTCYENNNKGSRIVLVTYQIFLQNEGMSHFCETLPEPTATTVRCLSAN
jgi:hypothetical protein